MQTRDHAKEKCCYSVRSQLQREQRIHSTFLEMLVVDIPEGNGGWTSPGFYKSTNCYTQYFPQTKDFATSVH